MMAEQRPQDDVEMSTSSSEESDFDIPSSPFYKQRPDWKDVEPIYNTPEEDAVVKVDHSSNFTDAFAYFRAIMHKNELSERAFELTTTCSQLNPANYSVWQVRRNILKTLNKDLEPEFKFTEDMINENPKNYQIWHHRRVLVDWTSDPSRELKFTQKVLDGDSKNYHAWQHRQWAVEKYDLFNDTEIDYSTQLLSEDLRNNSAWNYRYFLVKSMSNAFENQEILNREIEFVKQAIRKLINNESSWCYLNGLLVNDGLSSRPDVLEFCKELRSQTTGRAVHMRHLMFEYYSELIEKSVDPRENGEAAFKLLDELIEFDPVRKSYYGYLRERVNNLLTGLPPPSSS